MYTFCKIIQFCCMVLHNVHLLQNHAAELDDFAEGVHCEELNLCEWKQLLLCLDEESRKIVELYYFDEFSVKEISALLEMNSNTVSTKLSRARAKLKKVIRR